MIPEDERARRGEPVIIVEDGREIKGTIEWGGVTRPASIYTEPSGRRVVGVAIADIQPDPGGERPTWARWKTRVPTDWKPTYQGEHFRATFRPKRLDTLRPENLALVGERGEFYAAWIIDHRCDYEGQWACMTFDPKMRDLTGWLPFEDFEEVEPMRFDAERGVWI